MNYFVAFLIVAFPVREVFAQPGRSVEECNRRYGRPSSGPSTNIRDLTSIPGDPPARVAYDYSWRGFTIRALFSGRDVSDTRCVSISFWHTGSALTDAEIDTLLATNADGSSWTRVEGGWKRSDNRALAVTANNQGMLEILTPDFYRRHPPDYLRSVLRSLPSQAQHK